MRVFTQQQHTLADSLRRRAMVVSRSSLDEVTRADDKTIIECYVLCRMCMVNINNIVMRSRSAEHFLILCDHQHRRHAPKNFDQTKKKKR